MFSFIQCVLYQWKKNKISTTFIKNNAKEVLEHQSSTIISCIDKLLTKKFVRCGSLVTIVDTTHLTNPLIRALSNNSCYSFILRSVHTHSRLQKPEIYIIVSSDMEQFKSSINKLTKEFDWNPKAKIFLTFDVLEKEEILEIFEILLTHNIFDVLLIKEEDNVAKVYTFNPFDKQKCGQVTNDMINEEECSYIDHADEKKLKNLVYNFQNCSIVVVATEDVINFVFKTNTEFSYLGDQAMGIEQRLLENVAKLENFKIEYVLAGPDLRYGVILPNHTITGVLGYLQNDTVNIAAGGFFLIRNRVEMFDFIWGYNYANIYLYTPALKEGAWKKVYQEFSITTWILIVVSFLFTSFAISFLRKYVFGRNDDELLIVIKIWGYIYGNADHGLLFSIKKMRFIILLWILFTFFICSFYNTAYFSVLTRKDVEKLVMKPDNLQSLRLKPCVPDTIRTFYEFNFNMTLPGAQTKSCQYTKNSLDTVANSNGLYSLEMDYSYKLREYRYIDTKGRHKLQQSKYSNDLVFALYTKRGFPLLDKFQRYAAYHFESGIFQKHIDEIYHSNKILHQRHKPKYRNSRLSDYKIHFCILFLGYFLSTVCFMVEIYKKK